MRSLTGQRLIKPLAASLLTLAAGIAHADFKSDYSDGIKAADKANWANARAKMQSAISAEPNPQARVRLYGMVFSAYIPHYYLALAASKLGDCAGATAALNNAAHKAFMQQANGVEEQQAQSKLILSQCAAKSGTLPSTQPGTPQPPIAPPATNLASNVPVATNTAPDPQIAADAAAAVKAAALAQQAREAKLAADKLAAQQASTSTPPPVVARPPVPAELARVAASYFAGNLKEAALNNLTGLSGKALAHALLLRAAAKHGIYQQQGAKSAQQLLDLQADLISAKRADATVKPTARYFSREFIGLYAAP